MKKTTQKRGITIPTSKILAYTGDGSDIAEKVKNEYFAWYTSSLDNGLPIIETRIQYYRNFEGVLRYRQIFSCPKCGKLHIHGMNQNNQRVDWRASHCSEYREYILYINSGDFIGMWARGFWPETPSCDMDKI